MLRFVTTADTEILATAAAVERLPDDFPEVRCANPGGRPTTPRSSTTCSTARASCCAGSSAAGAAGRRLRPAARRAAAQRGDRAAGARRRGRARRRDDRAVDWRRRARSPRPASTCATATSTTSSSCCASSPTRSCSRATASRRRARSPTSASTSPASATCRSRRRSRGCDPARPTVGICFYRSHRLTGNTAFVDALCARDRGRRARTRWRCGATRCGATPTGDVPALALLDGHVDALITTMLATGGSGAADTPPPRARASARLAGRGTRRALAALDVPVIQAVCCDLVARDVGGVRHRPDAARRRDAGRDPRVRRAAARRRHLVQGARAPTPRRSASPVPRYVARPRALRARRAASRSRTRGCATRPPPSAASRVLLTAFPTKHAKIGMAVGLDTPASAIELLDALRDDGMRVEHDFADGDALMHALVAAGGHDPEFLTDEQLAAAPLRLPVADYLGVVRDAARGPARRRSRSAGARRPATATSTATTSWSRASSSATSSSRSSRRAATARTRSGSTTTPSCRRPTTTSPATAGSTARWGARRDRPPRQARHAGVDAGQDARAERVLRARRRARRRCRSSTRSSSTTPGEGVQAKRRAHATIVDHLVPPMMRADTYDEIAELEALLDEYARLEVLDPSKLPGLAARIWTAIEAANLQADLDIHERPDDVGALVEHIDGYLCEVKDIQIKDGLHVLGQRAARRAAARARRRRCCGSAPATCPGCGARSARPSGSTSRRSWRRRGAPAPPVAGRPASSASAARRRARATSSTGSRTRTWRCSTGSPRAAGRRCRGGRSCREVLGRRPTRASSARCASPATRSSRGSCATPDELTARRARAARRATSPSGPSGAPTRGRIDVLPTGRNFYCVDPRALPVGAVLGGRPAARRRAARAPPRRDRRRCRGWSGSSPGARPRCARRATTSPRSSRCSACARRGTRSRKRVTGIEVDPARRARPPAHRRDRAHLRLLPRRLPAPRARCSTTPSPRSPRSTSPTRTTTSPPTRAPTPSGWPRELGARAGVAARDDARSSAPSPAPTAPACCSCSTRATGATTPTSPPSTRRGAATPTAAASDGAPRVGGDARLPTRASRSRSRTSTRASTTSSTPTTTTSTTAAWSRPCAP